MKVVAISQRMDTLPERDETRDTLDQRLSGFIASCGYIPVPIPNNMGVSLCDWLAAVQPSAIVLSGGNDIGNFAERDGTELTLLTHGQEHHLPVLGICRGMQMLAYWSGTGLHPVQGHVRTRHCLAGEIIGEVNSYHGFSLATCPKGFEVLARSEDGEIEAIRHLSLPWEGWMWHPEREENFGTRDIQRLKTLFDG